MSSFPRPVLYMDVDGVLNFFGSRTGYENRADALGYLRRTTVSVPEGNFRFNWSGELVRKLAHLDVDWVWLTTWMNYRELLDATFGVVSAAALTWPVGLGAARQAGKFEALVADQLANPRPFVWVDDEATVFYDAARLPDVPHLVLAPDDRYGLTGSDLARVTDFVAAVSV